MESWTTTADEIADIIFNSSEADLNDLLCEIAATGKYSIRQLLLEIASDVNKSWPAHLRSDDAEPLQRRNFLKEEIRSAFIYYIVYARRATSDLQTTAG